VQFGRLSVKKPTSGVSTLFSGKDWRVKQIIFAHFGQLHLKRYPSVTGLRFPPQVLPKEKPDEVPSDEVSDDKPSEAAEEGAVYDTMGKKIQSG
jgi:hypothetical protein